MGGSKRKTESNKEQGDYRGMVDERGSQSSTDGEE